MWAVPAGDTITNAAGLDSIVVNWYNPGTVSVKASNACGTSAAVTKHVTPAPFVGEMDEQGKTILLIANIFPNPAFDAARLEISGLKGQVVVTLTDLTGKKVWQEDKLTNGTYTIPLGNLSAGLYIVTVKDDISINSLKLIKAR